jgi:hypothetical protein
MTIHFDEASVQREVDHARLRAKAKIVDCLLELADDPKHSSALSLAVDHVRDELMEWATTERGASK